MVTIMYGSMLQILSLKIDLWKRTSRRILMHQWLGLDVLAQDSTIQWLIDTTFRWAVCGLLHLWV